MEKKGPAYLKKIPFHEEGVATAEEEEEDGKRHVSPLPRRGQVSTRLSPILGTNAPFALTKESFAFKCKGIGDSPFAS